MNKTESCYIKADRSITLHVPKVSGTPIVKKVKVKRTNGAEEVVSRRKFKKIRKDQKAWRRQNKRQTV